MKVVGNLRILTRILRFISTVISEGCDTASAVLLLARKASRFSGMRQPRAY